MPVCENCGEESEELIEWFVYDTEEKEVKIKKVCPDCAEEYEEQASDSKISEMFQEKMEEKQEE